MAFIFEPHPMQGRWLINLVLQLIIFIAFLIIVWWMLRNNKKTISNDKPIDILKKRLAKGEISTSEYHKLRKEIE